VKLYPFVYEINTWVWLHELARREARAIHLGTVPERDWDDIAALGFDAVWLMGVWERSPAGIAVALADPGLVDSFRGALPDYRPEDVVGSPYCVRRYVVDERLGGPEGLARARAALAARGLDLILDFVPNHVAPDHPWAEAHAEYFVLGGEEDVARDAASFTRVGGQVLANGRDPFFPAWPDVVQLNAFSPTLRAAVVETLLDVASRCDGVRCDMAMLFLNDVFERTWGERVGPRPAEEYWDIVIRAVTDDHPDFVFLAEAYWDLEWTLQQHGFRFRYDKRLYDRLVNEGAEDVRGHLSGDVAYQEGLLRFVENHDEPRAAATFSADKAQAAAGATLTQTGARLVHEGQLDGRKVRLPVFLGRRPDEPPDEELRVFYRRLLTALRDDVFRHGEWVLAETRGWPGDERWQSLVAWTWQGGSRWLVVVNLGDATAAGLAAVPWDDVRGRDWLLVDTTNEVELVRSGDDLRDGLYVELPPWRWHFFQLTEREEQGDAQES
jgi:glycosidase